MKRLSDSLESLTESFITSAKQSARERAELRAELGIKKEQYHDFSYLNPSNLEDKDWVIEGAPYFLTKAVPLCGECQNGLMHGTREENAERYKAPYTRVCKRCGYTRRWLQRLNRLRLPPSALGMNFDVYEYDSEVQERALSHFIAWTKGSGGNFPGLYMHGPPGNGKSSALYCLAREATYRGKRVRYTTHAQILDGIKKTYNDPQAKHPLDMWLDGVDLLLLDEAGGLGGGTTKNAWWAEHSAKMFEEIHTAFMGSGLKIVATSNLSPAELSACFAQKGAIASRLKDIFAAPVLIQGRDRRGEQTADWSW